MEFNGYSMNFQDFRRSRAFISSQATAITAQTMNDVSLSISGYWFKLKTFNTNIAIFRHFLHQEAYIRKTDFIDLDIILKQRQILSNANLSPQVTKTCNV